MALTRDFRKTIQARAKRDPAYREAMLTEAVGSFKMDKPRPKLYGDGRAAERIASIVSFK